jgi:hypothetical protein
MLAAMIAVLVGLFIAYVATRPAPKPEGLVASSSTSSDWNAASEDDRELLALEFSNAVKRDPVSYSSLQAELTRVCESVSQCAGDRRGV